MSQINSDKINFIIEKLKNVQNQICMALEQSDGEAKFISDNWESKLGVGESRVLKNGAVFEQAGVNFSHVKGNKMPASATANRPELAGASFEACGVSLVIHPKNPYVPTSHANIRFFVAYPENQETQENQEPVWWFGGGFDLTPFYPFDEDIIHWHTVAKNVCDKFGAEIYSEFKQNCDEYFYLKHRGETRGVGGLFFDDFNKLDFDTCVNLIEQVGLGYIDAYQPIVDKRKNTEFTQRERDFQLYRRGRYVEFNLVWDRGTLFGLQTGGRTESILMSMPPLVRFEYQYAPEPNSPEARLNDYLQPKNWLNL